nr:putative ubiquitin conjugation factor e4 [Quercus suber]
MYLELTAAEILSESKELIDRLSASTTATATAEPPFQYLVGRYCCAYNESKKISSMKDPNLRSQLDSVINSVDGFGGSSSGGTQSPPGFLDEFFKDSDFDTLDPILKGLYEDLKGTVIKVSALRNFQQPLRALLYLVNFPVGAKVLGESSLVDSQRHLFEWPGYRDDQHSPMPR